LYIPNFAILTEPETDELGPVLQKAQEREEAEKDLVKEVKSEANKSKPSERKATEAKSVEVPSVLESKDHFDDSAGENNWSDDSTETPRRKTNSKSVDSKSPANDK